MNDGFADRVFAVVGRIPAGRVATYGDVARMAGRPAAARAVGRLMAQGTRPGVPYHRVIGAGGALGGYGSGPAFKAERLRSEGLTIRGGRVAEFAKHRFPSTPLRAGPSTSLRPTPFDVAPFDFAQGRPSGNARPKRPV